ncbi:MAG TPA: MG2 domain-containing protein [Planctomycetota bacterium]|nr:MG2 domain-containing protein [Planctomycetota bacterium]
MKPHLRVLDAEQMEVPYDIVGVAGECEVDLQCQTGGEKIHVVLGPPRGATSSPPGRVPETRIKVSLTQALRVTDVLGEHVTFGTPSLEVFFSHPIVASARSASGPARLRLEEHFTVHPATPFTAAAGWSSVVLTGPFEPGISYRVTVKKGLPGAGGSVLEVDETRDVRIPDRQASLSFRGKGRFLSSSGQKTVALQTVGVESVSLRAFRVQASNVVHWLHLGWPETRSSRALAPRVLHLPPIPGVGASNGIREVAIELLDVVGPDPRGVWYLEASGQETGTAKLLCVSDIAITAREASRDSMTVWTASLRTGEPVGGARVGLWTVSNQLLGEAVSGPDGLVSFPGPLTGGEGSPYLVTAERDGDLAYLDLRRQRLSRAHFDVGGRPAAARLEAFIFTERGVYSPGETVHVRALVRGPGGALPGRLSVEVETLRPDGNRLRLEKPAPGREGSFDVDLPLSPSAVLGLYRVRVLLPGGGGPGEAAPVELGSESFRVEERLPFHLEASAALVEGSGARGAGGTLRRFRPGDVAGLVVKGTRLFGLPAAGREVDASWRLVSERFNPPGWKGFRFGELSPRGIRIDRDRETSFLDGAGEARFQLELPDVETASLMRLELTAAVKDLAGRAVTAQLHALVDPAALYLGLRLDAPEGSRGRIDAGKPARFECIAVRPDGSLAAMETADLLVQEVVWHPALKETSDGAFAYESRDEVREIARQRVPFSGGRGAFEHTFEGGGSYRLRVRDPASLAAAEISVEASAASGGPAGSLENPDRVDILFADPRCRPGTMARVMLRAPFGGTLLLTTESDAVQTARVISMPRNTLEVDVFVPEDARSGLHVAASVVRGVDPDGALLPQRAYGIAPIPLDLSALRLTVTLHAPREARPGSRSAVRAVVADGDGEPLAGAEVFLALVEESALALTRRATPDPFEFFHGKRAHGVEHSDSYLSLLEEVPLEREASRPGGDRAGAREATGERSLHPIEARGVNSRALVLGPFTTGEDGGVVANFELPRLPGELRIFAVASAGDRFGASDRSVLVKGPFFFEMRLPRFLAPGDVFTVPVEIHNHTGASGVPSFTWTLDGIVEGRDAVSPLAVPSGEPSAAPLAGPVPAGGSLAFAASKGGALDVASGGSGRVDFTLRALERVGKASARLEASLGPETWSETIELPVRPAAPRLVRRESGEVTAGMPLEVARRGEYLAGTSRSTLVLSALPTLELVGPLGWLLDDTHDGLEHATSRAFPLLYLLDLTGGTVEDHLLKHAAANSIAGCVAGADDLVLAGVRGILEMQGRGGWLAAWPGSRAPWAWGTLYAAHFLVEARAAGHAVPEAEMEALLRHVESTTLSTEIALSMESESDARILERAYALYVLALARRPRPGALDALREALLTRGRAGDPAPPSAIYLLGGAFHLAGEGDIARDLISGDLPSPGQERETGGTLQSAPREAAILLSMLLDVDPASSRIPILVNRLKDHRVAGRWGTTQENAFALIALGKCARLRSETRDDYRAEVSVAGGDAVILGPAEERAYTWESLEGSVRVMVTGTGTLHYHWSEEGVPAGGAPEEGDHSIAVRRRYLDRSLAPLDSSAVSAGDCVVVEITVESDRQLENVAVTDRLPAGLEVESIALTGALGAAAGARDGAPSAMPLSPEHVSLRDDRVVFFVSLAARTRGVYRYAARAVTRGLFRVPPVEAEALYEPETRSVWGGGSFTVK